MKTFIVCSFGGCGSYTLMNALKKHGKVIQIHDNKLPTQLCQPNNRMSWTSKVIPDEKLDDIYVIYLYGNVSNAYICRGCAEISPAGGGHLKNIKCSNYYATLEDVLIENKDIFGYTEFYNNYTSTSQKRNYKLYCVKFSELYNCKKELSKELGIEDLEIPIINVKSYETKLNNYIKKNNLGENDLYKNAWNKLNEIFYDVNNKIETSKGFYII